ncbi:fumarate reductase subunit FrdC [Budviciaceae bacterium BWR-B9]|uniref:Fumarate reductase subunit C n=1 Tax=Limnobaculum allomyrinae TaxID=2791986 RepID=A0ABS1IW90_9GAMM|nr:MULTISPECIES: fumarate reductase subunit FrdC [Limnobaculum]MBK5146023.1 fumarate reductase subunit FrdC [Limnobaculum allomyrinae]MBV7694068.1 fumarate reductase subunit FrdC [Limnobaculum sp. M2-1]
MMTKRKPYVREVKADWWKRLGFYKFYMFRESTAIPAVWFSLVLIFGVFALRSPESWYGFVGFLANPVVMVINIITLIMALVHTKTWFDLAPKAANIVVGTEKLSAKPIVMFFWGVTIVASLIILAVALI